MRPAIELALLVTQFFQVAHLFLHDWIPLGRLNNLHGVRAANPPSKLLRDTLISGIPYAVGLAASLFYYGARSPEWLRTWLWISYGVLFLGELRAWWFPYLIRPEPARAAAITPCSKAPIPGCLRETEWFPILCTSCFISERQRC